MAILAETGRFDSGDARWQDQIAALHAALREEAGTVSSRGVPEPGWKGAVDTVLLALGSSGALTAAVACFRAWLARDKTRTLTVTWTDEAGDVRSIRVSGDNVDQASFQALAEGVRSRLGGSGDNVDQASFQALPEAARSRLGDG
ncbi:effector-associated constant component EACC1 [Kitasatospora aureofaciens]|uniref:effector-associated constant component EACC1 n=1 Tax=Kitasatospora aureofaciens TaxID=1894 RepID=UPI0033D9F80C